MPTLARRPNNKKKPNNIERNKEEELAKVRKKPLNPNGRNDGSRAYKIVKMPQGKQTGPREPREESSKPMEIIVESKQNGSKEPKERN